MTYLVVYAPYVAEHLNSVSSGSQNIVRWDTAAEKAADLRSYTVAVLQDYLGTAQQLTVPDSGIRAAQSYLIAGLRLEISGYRDWATGYAQHSAAQLAAGTAQLERARAELLRWVQATDALGR